MNEDWGHDDCSVCEAARESELLAARKLVALVRRWTSDHASNGKPCHCLLCTAIRRYDKETAGRWDREQR